MKIRLSCCLFLFWLLIVGCSKSNQPTIPITEPNPLLPTNPDKLVLRYWPSDRNPGPYSPSNLIPPLQIWGDGRVIWLAEGSSPYYERAMYEGYLSPEQLIALEEEILRANFYQWDARQGTSASILLHQLTIQLPTYDAKYVRIYDNALEETKSLLQYIITLPHSIEESIPYVPETGLLTIRGPIEEIQAQDNQLKWITEEPKLSEVGEAGILIEGDALMWTWTEVNKIPYAPLTVQDAGKVYFISLAIPGVSICTDGYPDEFNIRWICH